MAKSYANTHIFFDQRWKKKSIQWMMISKKERFKKMFNIKCLLFGRTAVYMAICTRVREMKNKNVRTNEYFIFPFVYSTVWTCSRKQKLDFLRRVLAVLLQFVRNLNNYFNQLNYHIFIIPPILKCKCCLNVGKILIFVQKILKIC